MEIQREREKEHKDDHKRRIRSHSAAKKFRCNLNHKSWKQKGKLCCRKVGFKGKRRAVSRKR